MTSLLDRLAGLAVQTGPRLVARPRARYERRIDQQLLEELEVERVAASVAEPWRVVRHPPVTGREVSPARPPRARPPLDGEQPEAFANPQSDDTAGTGPTVTEPRAKPPVVDSQAAARPDVTPAMVTRPDSSDELVVIVEHAWPDDEARHRRPAAARESAPPPAGALTSNDDIPPEVQAPGVRHELVRTPAEPSRQRPTVRPSAPEPGRRRVPTPAAARPITVTIGRIELRTVEPPPPPLEARKATAATAPSPLRFNGPTLDEFLGGLPG